MPVAARPEAEELGWPFPAGPLRVFPAWAVPAVGGVGAGLTDSVGDSRWRMTSLRPFRTAADHSRARVGEGEVLQWYAG